MTIPHKQAVISFCDELDEIALAAGSVNTLVFADGRVLGSSTDGDAVAAQVDPRGRRALVLGDGRELAGGRGGARAGRGGGDDGGRRDAGWPPSADGYDILVNATPVKDEVIVAPHAGMEVVDLAYLPDGRDTALIAAARAAGCEVVVDGLDVLLFQGAAAFERWTGLAGTARGDARGAARLLMDEAILARSRRALQRGGAHGRLRADAGGVRSRCRDGVRGRPGRPVRRSRRDRSGLAAARGPPSRRGCDWLRAGPRQREGVKFVAELRVGCTEE